MLIVTFVFLISTSLHCTAQCSPPNPVPLIVCGTGTPLADNVTINAGQVYYYNGTGGSFSNITVNGGTLLLCGTVTITNININSGDVVITAVGAVTFNGSFNAGTNNFFNSGVVTFNANVNVQGTNTFIFNAVGATMTVNGSLTVFNSGQFINNGTATANDIILNSGANVCFGANGSAHATNITNNQTNVATVPTGIACVSYSSSFTGNNPITATSGLHICQLAGATAPQPVVVGAATVVSPCTSCGSVLGQPMPLKLSSFKGTMRGDLAILVWETAWEENVESFMIERSRDGANWTNTGTVNARNQPSRYEYSLAVNGASYYRLKMGDIDGRFTYSSTIHLLAAVNSLQITILSNPIEQATATLSIAAPRVQQGELLIVDQTGRPVIKRSLSLGNGVNNITVDLHGLGSGQYYVYFNGMLDKSAPVKLVKL